MIKQSLVVIGTLTVIMATVFILFKYNRYDHQALHANQIADYEKFNDQLIKASLVNTFIDSTSDIENETLKEAFRHLRMDGKIIFIDRAYEGWVVYKVQHEKVKPIYGIGLNYFSHYLVYGEDDVTNFEGYFKDSYSEEEFVTADRVKENWYYVIGEYYSD